MIFSIDTGNDKIKTESRVTQAGLVKLDYKPEESEEAIYYNGAYYKDTVERLSYLYDKTVDDRYFILTLLALARELEAGAGEENGVSNGLIEIALLVGLPPAHYAALREKFKEYFSRGKNPVTFGYKGKTYTVVFNEVVVNIQGYSVYLLLSSRMGLNEHNKVCLIDLGGMTIDYLILRYGELDKADSLELGMITLYNKIKSSINRKYHMLLDEADIYNILKRNKTKFSEEIINQVFEIAKAHVVELLGIFREVGIDFNTTLTIFVGGGSIVLADIIKEVWERYQSEYFVVSDINANAKGYKMQYLIDHNMIGGGSSSHEKA